MIITFLLNYFYFKIILFSFILFSFFNSSCWGMWIINAFVCFRLTPVRHPPTQTSNFPHLTFGFSSAQSYSSAKLFQWQSGELMFDPVLLKDKAEYALLYILLGPNYREEIKCWNKIDTTSVITYFYISCRRQTCKKLLK